MSARVYATVTLFLIAAAPAAYAQAPESRPAPRDSAVPCAGVRMADSGMSQMGGMQGMRRMGGMGNMGGMGQEGMPMPTAADNARLDSLVNAMHRTKGDKKLAAMEKVIDELLAHRRMMQDHMMRMMRGGMEGGRGPGMKGSGPTSADSMDHSQHH